VPGEADVLCDRLTAWAARRADVHAALLVGSRARRDHPADEYSDLDVVLIVDDPEILLGDDEWLQEFGAVSAQVVEPTAIGGMTERRVLFASGQDVDFSVVPVALATLLGDFVDLDEVRELFGRGVRVLFDQLGISEQLESIPPPEPGAGLLSEREYHALSSGFWYQLIVAAKKLRRGELWVALASCEGRLTATTVELARWWMRLRQPATDIWHSNRFVEEWLDPSVMSELAATRPAYGEAEIRSSLVRLAALFGRLELDCREATGFAPAVDERAVQDLFRSLTEDVGERDGPDGDDS
jgi:aminoglycoside 6-adenylyltransferase